MNTRTRNLTGQVMGQWTILKSAGVDPSGNSLWLCRCSCGKEKTILGWTIIKGASKSCGCGPRRGNRVVVKKQPEYSVWRGMIQRCHLKTATSWALYGGRGISVHPPWHKFENFLDEVGKRPSMRHTLNRIDNDGNYEPGNVEWVTHTQQQRNRRNNHLLFFNGVSRTIAEWAEIYGIAQFTLYSRLQRGWSVSRALEGAPVECPKCHHQFHFSRSQKKRTQ